MAILTLYPFTTGEATDNRFGGLKQILQLDFKNIKDRGLTLVDAIKRGTFPEIAAADAETRRIWFDSYITAILQRDVRQIADLEKISLLPHLLNVLAARTGALMNDSDIARDVGLNSVTGKFYRNILKLMFLTFDVRPWYRNVGKRLVKSPKGYLIDTCLICHLLDYSIDDIAFKKPDLFGHLIENFIATELLKQLSNSDIKAELYHFRTSGGNPTNQVQSIVDGSGSNSGLVNGTTTYTWDGTNGNLVSSNNTSVTTQNKSFTYNLLNLPQTAVTNIGGTDTYTYDATGVKLRKVNVNGATTVTTDYISGIQYNNSTTAIGFIQTEEGKAVPTTSGGYDYTYYLGDNLGNTRVTFSTKTGSAVSVQQDDYLPFGMEILRTSPPPNPKNEYLYNKKELQEELQEYDYGARFYDPVIGRWNTVDPLAEENRRESPYVYVSNNPMRMTDPDGMDEEDDILKKNSLEEESDNLAKNQQLINNAIISNAASTALAVVGMSPSSNHGTTDDGPDQTQTIKPVNNNNKKNISDVSVGETLSLYPTKTMHPTNGELYNPSKWDPQKTADLLAARSAIDFLYNNRNNKFHTSDINLKDRIEAILAPYHLKDNFPNVDPLIKNDPSVKFFYIGTAKDVKSPSIDSRYWNQRIVKSYGPFYNTGGGDVPRGPVYLIFYSATKK